MRALFYTLGCKVNQYETQAMMRCMADNGYETGEYLPGSPDAGDAVIVLNSCTVTGESDRKLRQLLRRCRRETPSRFRSFTASSGSWRRGDTGRSYWSASI